jgi:hypothetical protein
VSQLSRQCGILYILQPCWPPLPATGTALLYKENGENVGKDRRRRKKDGEIERQPRKDTRKEINGGNEREENMCIHHTNTRHSAFN